MQHLPLILIVAQSLLFAERGHAEVPPEIPVERTVQIYSPFYFDFKDSGESIFVGDGSAAQLGYMRDPHIWSVKPTGDTHSGSLAEFKTLLETPAGVLFVASHGNTGRILVEAYSSLAKATNTIAAYMTGPDSMKKGEIDLSVPGPTFPYYGIKVLTPFLEKYLEATHSIVYANACWSASLSSTFLNTPFVRAYIGFQGLVDYARQDSLDAAGAIFGNMAGAYNDNADHSYRNEPLASLISVANAAMQEPGYAPPTIMWKAEEAPGKPFAGDIRLYNAPRIVLADLSEDANSDGSYGKLIYKFRFGNDVYPYAADAAGRRMDYPSGGEILPVEGYSGGPLKLELRFSEPMTLEQNKTAVTLVPAGSETGYSFDWANTKWTSEHMPSPDLYDTWTGHLVLPENLPEGEARIEVLARHRIAGAGLDVSNQGLDIDGDGRSVLGMPDTSIRFVVQRYRPLTKRISVGPPGKAYTRKWQCGDTTCTLSAPPEGLAVNGAEHPVTVVFSEPVKVRNSRLSVIDAKDGSTVVGSVSLGSDQPEVSQTTFTGTLRLPDVPDGKYMFSIEAADYGGLELLALNSQAQSINIETQLKDLVNGGGIDSSFRFKLDSTLPEYSVSDAEDGAVIEPGGTSKAEWANVKVTDLDAKGSGPGCMELWYGDPGTASCGSESLNPAAQKVGSDYSSHPPGPDGFAYPSIQTAKEGWYFLKAADKAGNNVSGTFHIMRPPKVSLNPPLPEGAWTPRTSAEVDVVDTSPARLELYLDGTLITSNDEDHTDKYTYTSADPGLEILGDLPDGTILIKAYDLDDKVATFSFKVDRTAPTFGPNPEPAPRSYVRVNNPTISVTMTDNKGGSGLDRSSVELWVDDELAPRNEYQFDEVPPSPDAGDSVKLVYIPLTPLGDGARFVSVIVRDNVGNQGVTGAWHFIIDRTPPSCTVIKSGSGCLVGRCFPTLAISAADDVGISNVHAYLKGPGDKWWNGWGFVSTKTAVGAFPGGPVAEDGDYHASCVAFDRAGNQTVMTGDVADFTVYEPRQFFDFDPRGYYLRPGAALQGWSAAKAHLECSPDNPPNNEVPISFVQIGDSRNSDEMPSLRTVDAVANWSWPLPRERSGSRWVYGRAVAYWDPGQGVTCDANLVGPNLWSVLSAGHSINVDGAPPYVTGISIPPAEDYPSQIAGTVTDDVGASVVWVSVVDETSKLAWDPYEAKWVPSAGSYPWDPDYMRFGPSPGIEYPGVQNWSYNLAGGVLGPERTYKIAVRPVDRSGNNSGSTYLVARTDSPDIEFLSRGRSETRAEAELRAPRGTHYELGGGPLMERVGAAAAALGLAPMTGMYYFGPREIVLASTVPLIMRYEQLDHTDVGLYAFDEASGVLAKLPAVEYGARALRAELSALGYVYGVFGKPPARSIVVLSTAAVERGPELSFDSNDPELVLAKVDARFGPVGAAILAMTDPDQGITLLGAPYAAQPENKPLVPGGKVLFRYSDAALTAGGLDAADVVLYRFDEGTAAFVPVAGQGRDAVEGGVRAAVGKTGIFALFGMRNLAPDATPPLTTVSGESPLVETAPGRYVTRGLGTPPKGRISLSAVDAYVQGAKASGVAEIRYWLDEEAVGPGTLYLGPLELAGGEHTLGYASRDAAGNQEEPVRTMVITVDGDPPLVAHSFWGSSAVVDGEIWLATSSSVGLTSSDPDLAVLQYLIDAELSRSSLDDIRFSLAEGSHMVVYQAQDQAGNIGAASTITVRVDATAPDVHLSIEGASLAPDGTLFVSYAATLTLRATDAGSGVARLLYRIDGTAYETADAETVLSLSEGSHLVAYSAVDKVGNAAAEAGQAVWLDAGPPVTGYEVLGTSVTVAGTTYFAPSAFVRLTSTDTGSGVALLYYAVDGTASASAAGSAELLLTEGVHTVESSALDRFALVSSTRTVMLAADGTAPETELWVAGAGYSAGTVNITGDQPIELKSWDPEVNGAASQVDTTYFLINKTPEECGWGASEPVFVPSAAPGSCLNPIYKSTFTLFDGTHTVGFFSKDRLGNQDAGRAVTIIVTGNPVATLVGEFGGSGIGDGNFAGPSAVAASPLGNYLYVTDAGNQRVQKFTPDGRWTKSFGSAGSIRGTFGAAGPTGVAVGRSENPIVADPGNHRIQIFDTNGNYLHSIGNPGSAYAVAADTRTSAIFAWDGGVIRKYSLSGTPLETFGQGIAQPTAIALRGEAIYVLAGNQLGIFRSGSPAVSWNIGFSGEGLALDAAGRMYISAAGAVHVIAPDGRYISSIGGLGSPKGLAVDRAGRLYVADSAGNRIVVLQLRSEDQAAPAAVAGLAVESVSPNSVRLSLTATGDDGLAGSAALYELRAWHEPIDAANFRLAEPVFVGRFPGPAGAIERLSADGLTPGTTYYFALRAVDEAGNASALAAAQAWTPDRVPVGILSRFAGLEKGVRQSAEAGPATLSLLTRPVGLALDGLGTLYVGSSGDEAAVQSDRVLAVNTQGIVVSTAGSFVAGSSPDGVSAVEARLGGPIGVAATSARLLIAETSNSALRKVEGGILGSIPAQVLAPTLMAADAEGDVLIADSGHHRILRLDGLTGGVSPAAGSGTAGNDNAGQALVARLNSPGGVAFTPDGGFLVADTQNHRVAKVRDGYLTTVAGIGSAGYSGDGGPAASAALNAPMGLAVDPLGAFYIAESAAHVVRKVDVAGVITTVAGIGVPGDFGADGPAAQARLDKPMGLALDPARGLLFVADRNNDRVAAVGIDRFMSVASGRLVGGVPELVADSTGTLSLTEASAGGEAAAAAGLRLLTAVYEIAAGVIPGTEVPQSRLNFAFDPSGMEPGTIAVFHFDGATWSSSAVVLQRLDLSVGTGHAGGTVLAAGRWAVLGRPLDIMPPRTAFRHGEPSYGSGPLYVGSTTLLGFDAEDDLLAVGDKAGRGVERTYYGLDGGELDALGVYSSSFSLSTESVHDVRFYSMDRSGNYEDIQVSSVAVDATPPQTVPMIAGPWLERAEGIYAAGISTISLIAADRISSGTPVGFRRTLLAVDGAESVSLSAMTPLSLVEGPHELAWNSEDLLGNAEVLVSTHLVVDASPPAVSALSPAGEETFVAGKDSIIVSFAVVDFYDSAPSSAAVLVHTNGSSVTVANGQTIDPGSLLDGSWELRVSAVDFVQNSTVVVSGKFEVIRDILPPRTSLVLGQPSVPGDPAWVKSTTLLTLEAVDDAVTVGDAHGMGVARTSYSVDGASLEYSSVGFHLSGEGSHDVAYRSVDVVGHVEEVKVSSVSVDETPPSIAFTQPAPNAILNTVTPTILLSYSDTGSGIDPSAFTIRIDGVDLSLQASANGSGASLTPPSVGQGSHTVTASIADRLGNSRSVSLSFFVDNIPPQVTMTKPPGSYVNLKRPTMEGVASDYGAGLNTSAMSMTLDMNPVTAQITAPSGSGNPGPWTVAGNMLTGLYGMASAVWNGVLYVSGGGDGVGPFKNAVRYATIKPDGTLDSVWHDGPSLLHGMVGHEMVAVDGKLFVLGGYGSSEDRTYSDVWVAQIRSDGGLDNWVQSYSLPFPYGAQNLAATALNGYLYAMGGENNPYGQVSSKVYFAKICPGGLCGAWAETTSLPGPLDQIVAVTVGSTLVLYVPGGAPSGTSGISQVLYNTPNEDGTGRLNAWRTTTQMPRPVTNYAAVGAEGHIYVMGGTPSAEPVKTVDFAAVLPGGGVGPWTEQPQYDMPKALLLASAVTWDGRIFVVGGRGGQADSWAVSKTIFASTVRSDVPVVMATATYVPMADLAEGLHTVGLSASDKAGNVSLPQTTQFTVDSIAPSLAATAAGKSLGTGEPWVNLARPEFVLTYADAGSGVESASLAIALDGVDVTASAQIGEYSASFTPQVALSQGPHTLMASISDWAGNIAPFSADFKVDSILPQVAISTPTNGVFFTTSTVPMAAFYGDSGSGLSTGTLQLLLKDSPLPAVVDYAGGGTGRGIPGPWLAAGTLPAALLSHASAVWGDTAYVLGGSGPNVPSYSPYVWHGNFDANGGLSSWTRDADMPRGYISHGVVAAQNRLFIIGGQTAANVTYNSVFVATLAAGGGLNGGWQSSYDLSFPAGTSNMGVVEVGGYLYVVGGNNPNCQVFSQVYYAKICPDKAQGLCGPWTATASLPNPLDQMQVVAVNGMVYVYALGGISGGCSNTPTNQVWYTSPRTDGSGQLQSWTATAGLPRAVRRHVGLSAEGHIYVLGGSPSLNPVATVNFAEVNVQNGQLGPWSVDPQYNLPEPLLMASGLVRNNRLYVLGGANASWTVSNKIYASSVGTGLIASATAAYTGTLAQDHYLLSAVTQDLAANISSASVSFDVDWTPPTSSLVVDGVSRSFEGRLYVQGQPPLRIAAADAVSGVKESRLKVDAGASTVIAGTFTLAQGNHELAFYSVDRANNVESTKTASIKMDGMAPAAAADLVAVIPSTTGMTLAWTSPGDDGVGGTILSGEFRVQYANLPTTFDPSQAQIVENIIDQASGTAKSLRIEGLAPGTNYTFSVWTRDTAGNYSAAATVSAQTLSLAASADQVASIISPEPLLTVVSVTQAQEPGAMSVSVTQGLGTLTPTFYELNTGSPEPVHFSTPAVLSFVFDRTGVELDQVAIFKYMDVGGVMVWSSAPIVNQTLTQLSGDLYQITGQIYSASLYSVFEKRDILPPRTTLALGEPKYVAGETYLTAATELSLTAADDRSVVGDGDGSGVSGTQYALDGGAAALYTAPVRLSGEGPHDFAFFSVDLKNNLEARQSRRLVVDGTPPNTTVSLSTPSFEAFVSPLTTVKLSAQDPPSGVVPGAGLNKILFAVGAGQLGQGPLEFGLQGPDGKYELSYQAQDNLGNLETLQKKTYSLDSTPAVSVADIGAHSYSAPDGKKYVSPLTPVTLSAEDQTVNEVASGVQLIAVDLGQGYAPYTAPLTFTQGHHQIQYRATDKVGNMEQAKVLELYVDDTSPATLLSYDGYHLPRAETTLPPAEAEMFIMPQTKLILTAQDPGEISSGVGATEYRLDEGAWVAYSAPFSITADGLHTLAWRSKDRVDNEETAHSLKIAVIGDILPPRTVMQVGEPKYIASRSYVTSRTELTLSAIDDRLAVGDGLGVGVERTEYTVDEGASTRYSAPVKLSGEGPHAVGFFSADLLGHGETAQSRSLTVDDAPPATLVSLSTPSFGAYVSPLTTVKLSAQDPAAGSVPGSGLAKLLYAVGSGPMAEGVLEFGLKGADGKYELNYQAQDNLGNLEPIQRGEYSLDSTPPLSASAIGSPSYTAPDGKKYVSPLTPVTLSAQDQTINEVASGLKLIEVDLGQGFTAYQGPLSFAEGIREPRFRSLDNVGNMEIAKSLELYCDGITPNTAISYDGYHLSRAETVLPPPEAEMFVLPETKLILTAQDPGEVASGVGTTEYRLDEGAWLAYSAPFSITAEGIHTLAWRSRDRVANEEVSHSVKIAVINDILPPRTAMQVGEPKYLASRSYVTSGTELTLSAIDDRLTIGDGLGLGVDRTEYSVDGGASARYSAPVKLSGEGPHAVGFFSVDTKNNVEAGQDRTLAVDDAPPQTAVALSTPAFGAFVSPLTVIRLTAQDPPSGAVPGSGLSKLLYAIGVAQLAQGPLEFGLTGPDGKYDLNYQAQDNLGNLETLRKNTYSLDSTPPLSASAIGAHSYQAPDGKTYVSPVSQVALSATDPLVNEVAAGIKLIEADLGQGYAPYTAPLTFAQGHRQMQYRATDNVGNVESAKALELYVDGVVPVTAISYDGFHLTRADNPGLPPPEAEEFISPQTKVILTAQDPGTEAVSGVKLTEYRLDDGAWVAYSVPFSITAEGLHTLAWRSKDQVDNEEIAHSLKIAVMGDIQPPRTVMSIGTPKYVASDTYLTSATELTLTAVDDRLTVGDGLGLGVEKTEYSLDAGVLARYTAPIKLSGNGPHNVAFFSTDVLGHAEASQSRRLLVDDAPPITEIVLSGLRFTAQSGDPDAVGGPLFIASATLTAMQAQDPLMNGSASGLASLSYGLDTTALGPYSAAFNITPQGAHALKYLAVDNLGNTESLKTLSFSVDAAAPVTQISFTGPYFMQSVNSGAVPPEAEVFIARETRIVLTAHDPVVAETASGVSEIRYRMDGGAWLAYSQSLAILSGGLHTLEWSAKDRLGLEEAVHSLRIAVDVAAPISSLSIGEPKFLALGLDFVTPQTPIALSAVDLPNSGIAVGVQGISYRIDAGAELLYTASFTLAQGTHSIEFWAYDRAGNVEYRQSRLLTSTLLQTAALTGVDGITGSGTAQVTGKLLSNGRVALSGSVRVIGDAAGSPVALTGNASVSGIVSQNGAGTMPEPIDLALAEQLASAASSNALIPASFMKDGALVVTGNKTLLLATGTYVLKGLTLSGGASLDVAGPVRLFLDGPLQVSGGAKLNAGGTASSLVLFAKSGSIALSGGAQAVGLFYAPRSSLGISGNARIGGALFAKSVAITGDSNVIAAGEVLPPELLAAGGNSGKGGKTAGFDAGTVPGHSSLLAAADPSFMLRDLYAFPNPAVGGAKPVIHAAVGVADRVVVKIFDVSGRQTKEATLDGSPQVVDDGSGPKYAYEFTWDGHIPSGVYFYTIEAEKSGQKIRKAGRLAVVR